MSDEISTDDLFGDDPPKAAKPKRERKPRAAAKPKREPVEIDNAIAVRDIDWQCPCGNRNTHSLKACGKCREPRYTTA